MDKFKRTLHLLLVLPLLFGLGAQPRLASALEADRRFDESFPPAPRLQDIPDTFQWMGENELFQLYANQVTLAFKVVDKRNGYIWNSNLDEKVEGDKLNKTWTAFAQSGISIDYLDAKAASNRVSVSNADEVSIDFKTIDQGFEATVRFTEPAITVGVTVQLEADGVSVEIPSESIKEEEPESKLGLLYLYPFFGATRGDSLPGYMFIPDGSGSLIRFANETKAQNMYYGRYYGADLGMITYKAYDPWVNRPLEISIPVIGMAHGEKQNAYIAILEKGASYAEIQAHPAGIITNFNFLYNAFIYNESYFQATNRSGAGVVTLQPHTNSFDISMHYRFLTGADSDYVGMARSYQSYLVENGMLPKIVDPGNDIGIKLEFLGGDKEKVLFWHRLIPMTTVSQMADILDALNVKNPDVVYYGWQPLGASTMPPKTFKLDGTLGSINELRQLAGKITAGDGNFSIYLDPQAAFWYEPGYSVRSDLAMSITNENMAWYNRDIVNYYFNLDTLQERYPSLSRDVYSKLKVGLALDGLGSVLYSDFKKNHFINREDAIVQYQKMLAETQGGTSFYKPNDYVFKFMKAYYDMPLKDNGYIYTTESVPFLEIVLSGYVPYYGPALNFSSNSRNDLLKQVDYGVYPSYFLTQEATAKMLNTRSTWIYSSSYQQWAPDIEQTYQWMNSLLGPVKGQSIIARQTLRDGIVATTYANGKQIIVNYTDQPASLGGFVVNAMDAVLKEVLP